MKLSAIDFVDSYYDLLHTIGATLRDEYAPALLRMQAMDPHDLISPDTVFSSANSAYGFVYRLVLDNHKKGSL